MLFTSMYKILWQFALVPSRSLLQINQEPRLTVNHRVQKDTTSDCVEVPANRLAVDRFALAQHVSVCSKTKTHCLSWLNRLDPDQRDRGHFLKRMARIVDDLPRQFFGFGFGFGLFNCSLLFVASYWWRLSNWIFQNRLSVLKCVEAHFGRNLSWSKSELVDRRIWQLVAILNRDGKKEGVSESTFDLLVA